MTQLKAMRERAEQALKDSGDWGNSSLRESLLAQDVLRLCEALEKCKEQRDQEFWNSNGHLMPKAELQKEVDEWELELAQILEGKHEA